MTTVDTVYISYHAENDDAFRVPLESFIFSFVAQWVRSSRLLSGTMRVTLVNISCEKPLFNLPKEVIKDFSVKTALVSDLPHVVQQCTLPAALLSNRQLCIAGLCGVLRHILKLSPNEAGRNLLGFRRGCLAACAEVSVWTQFCEVDLVKGTEVFIKNFKNVNEIVLPDEVVRFETHLQYPLRTHNIYKKQHDAMRKIRSLSLDKRKKEHQTQSLHLNCKEEITLSGQPTFAARDVSSSHKMVQNDGVPNKNVKCRESSIALVLPHEYAEDVVMTLADLVIFACVHHVLHRLSVPWSTICSILPSVSAWYQRMISHDDVYSAVQRFGLGQLNMKPDNEENSLRILSVKPVTSGSLYIRDTKRYNPSARMFTKQNEVLAVIDKLKSHSIEPKYASKPDFSKAFINWHDLPDAVHPRSGDLPQTRLERKCQQLENMVNAARGIAEDGDTIVDFCSGGGHLGILLAHLLPKCHVIMIDNKEASIERVLIRTRTLPNTTVYQCNLGYFCGEFDIGVALHACGVAADLVLQRCIQVRSSFVICPCCYGGIHSTHLLSYPRSDVFCQLDVTPEMGDEEHYKLFENETMTTAMTYADE